MKSSEFTRYGLRPVAKEAMNILQEVAAPLGYDYGNDVDVGVEQEKQLLPPINEQD